MSLCLPKRLDPAYLLTRNRQVPAIVRTTERPAIRLDSSGFLRVIGSALD
ncbi:hypothetical protein RISK_006724 [Rhodopirellula islandica]|uniref:Uncharacterized protein n=1 Tax=Rhodopirellula islandica TaxID=595434 RepID=A0A0J1B2L0_RHOIS|nr:hypothetical protein RISK_006724 [Rhodopirellula islandica]